MKLFIGGYCGSGTRVIQAILKEAGFFIGDPICPVTYDYFPIECLKTNLILGHGIADLNMREVMEKVFAHWWGKHENWSIKHPFLMFAIPSLRTIFPESKFILVVRHGIDNILNQHTMDGDIGRIIKPSILKEKDILLRRMRFWNFAYKIAMTDILHYGGAYVIQLEKLVDNPVEEIKKMFKALKIKADPVKCAKGVSRPDSMGKRDKEIVITDEEEYATYDPKIDKKRLIKEGEEMLKFFKYESGHNNSN